MKVTINGVTYEGTEDEIRRIVENPPNGGGTINYPPSYPTNPGPYSPPVYPPWPPEYPPYPGNTDWPWGRRNWDGTPIVTCSVGDVLYDMFN